MANNDTAAKTPAAKPATKKAAAKPAAKPAAEKKPRTRRTAAQIAEDKAKAQGSAAQLPLDTTTTSPSRTSMAASKVASVSEALGDKLDLPDHLKRPQASTMAAPRDPALAEHNPALHHATRAELGGYASQPKAAPTGRRGLSPEEAMLQTGMGEVNPKAETEALNNLHEVETAKLIVGQALDTLRQVQVAKGEAYNSDNYYHGGSRLKSLVRWARYFGVELTAMVWLNGDVKAVTKAFDLNQKNGVYFPQHAHPFHYDVYDVDNPEKYKGYNGILLQPFNFDQVEEQARLFQEGSSFEATLELADRLAATVPLEELKRGDVLRSILNPKEHVIVLETNTKGYFHERSYGGYRGEEAPKGDILGVQVTFSKYDPFEPARLDSHSGTPRYFHSTLFERVKRLKLDSSNADFDSDELGGANLTK